MHIINNIYSLHLSVCTCVHTLCMLLCMYVRMTHYNIRMYIRTYIILYIQCAYNYYYGIYNIDDNNLGEPSKPLKVQHLMPYINDLADEVVSIAGWLGMDGELEVIKRTPGIINPREQLQELLKKWLEDTERPTAPHTWENFVGMVQGVRKGYVAEKIVEDVFTGDNYCGYMCLA